MKKGTLGQLAILGITSGLLSLTEGGVGLYADNGSIDMSHVISKKKCGKDSCGGLTAMGCGSRCSAIAMRDDPPKQSDQDTDADDDGANAEEENEEEIRNKEIDAEEQQLDENQKKKSWMNTQKPRH